MIIGSIIGGIIIIIGIIITKEYQNIKCKLGFHIKDPWTMSMWLCPNCGKHGIRKEWKDRDKSRKK